MRPRRRAAQGVVGAAAALGREALDRLGELGPQAHGYVLGVLEGAAHVAEAEPRRAGWLRLVALGRVEGSGEQLVGDPVGVERGDDEKMDEIRARVDEIVDDRATAEAEEEWAELCQGGSGARPAARRPPRGSSDPRAPVVPTGTPAHVAVERIDHHDGAAVSANSPAPCAGCAVRTQGPAGDGTGGAARPAPPVRLREYRRSVTGGAYLSWREADGCDVGKLSEQRGLRRGLARTVHVHPVPDDRGGHR